MKSGIGRHSCAIAVFSPHGNTRRVAEVAQGAFKKEGIRTQLIDLTGRTWDELAQFDYSVIQNSGFLLVTTPVYAWKIAEPMERFLANLPAAKGKRAGIVVTYGGVTSGEALLQAGKILTGKRYSLLGAAKVVASHSNVLDAEADRYRGHPNAEDLQAVQSLATTLTHKLRHAIPMPLPLSALRPQFSLIRLQLKTFIARRHTRAFPPGIRFNVRSCAQCGRCARACPLRIIQLDPYPALIGKCIKCHNCRRACPAGAISTTGIWRKLIFHYGLQRLHELALIRGEKPMTQIFV